MNRSAIILAAATMFAACADAELPTSAAPDVQMAKANAGIRTVTTLDDAAAGDCTNGFCTLRAAIAAAENGDRIVFKNNLSGTIVLTAGQLEIGKDITIDGAGRITVNANGASRVLQVINLGATITLSGLTLTGGHHPTQGGGIWNFADLTLIDCIVTGNSTDGHGGGIYNPDNLTLIRTTVSGNTAAVGGGIRSTDFATTALIASTVSGNQATVEGGAIRNTGKLTLFLSTVSGNSSSNVGGVYTSATAFGEAAMHLMSSTITRNTSTGSSAGGLFSGVVTSTMSNTIVAGNINDWWPDCEGNFTSLGYNLTRGGGACPANGVGDVVVIPSQLFTHVLEADLGDNGGRTMTHALIERGRAVDAGYCPGETLDQRGLARPFDEPLMPNALDACDIGAFEWQPVAPTTNAGKKPKK
jgi:CSLREA domain-containing protein